MVAVQPDFRTTVWTYTYASGEQACQVNSKDANKAWVCGVRDLVTKCDDRPGCRTSVDAQGLIVQDGFGKALNPSCGCPEGDGAPLVPYSHGERIWVESSFVQNKDDLVPVVSLDTYRAFMMPYEDICWTPMLIGPAKNGNQVFAVPVGPKRSFVNEKGSFYCQAFFQWPPGQPQLATAKWDKWSATETNPRRKLSGSQAINEVETRRNVFRQHWAVHRSQLRVRSFGGLGSNSSTILDGESSGANAHLVTNSFRHHPTLQSGGQHHRRVVNWTRCNLEPHCELHDIRIEGAFGIESSIEEIPHYHVLHSDLERCSAGSRHQQHCVLYNDDSCCAFADRHADHQCCVPLSAALGSDLQDRMAEDPRCQSEDYDAEMSDSPDEVWFLDSGATITALDSAALDAGDASDKEGETGGGVVDVQHADDNPYLQAEATSGEQGGPGGVQVEVHVNQAQTNPGSDGSSQDTRVLELTTKFNETSLLSGGNETPKANTNTNNDSNPPSTSIQTPMDITNTEDAVAEITHQETIIAPPSFFSRPLVINLRVKIEPGKAQGDSVTPANTPSRST